LKNLDKMIPPCCRAYARPPTLALVKISDFNKTVF